MRAITAAILLAVSHLTFAQTISVEDAQIRQPMPGRTVTAGYLKLHNHSGAEQKLIAVSSKAFASVELHQHSHKDGMMRMEQVDAITIPANGTVSLQPGGLHLMLFEPLTELAVGQQVELTLQFADAASMSVEAPVTAMPKR